MAKSSKSDKIYLNLSMDIGDKILHGTVEFYTEDFDEFYQEFFGRDATEKEQNRMMECLVGECARRLQDEETDVVSFAQEFFEIEQDKLNKRKRRKK